MGSEMCIRDSFIYYVNSRRNVDSEKYGPQMGFELTKFVYVPPRIYIINHVVVVSIRYHFALGKG